MNGANESVVRASSAARELVGVEVLVVDGDPTVQQGMAVLLAQSSLHVTPVHDLPSAMAAIAKTFHSVALIDIDTPSPQAGIEIMREIRAASPTTMIVAMTPRRSFEDAISALRAGAIDVVLKAEESVPHLIDRVLSAAGKSVGKREVDNVLIDVKNSQEEFLSRFMEAERRATEATERLAGKDPNRAIDIGELKMLVVDEVDSLYAELSQAVSTDSSFRFTHATSGGEGLDRVSSDSYHYALISEDLHDLPSTTVVRTIRTQKPDTVVLTFRGPGEKGTVKLVETNGTRTVVSPFTDANQLLERLGDLTQAWQAKARERKYTQAFREKHYDFLRRFVELRAKIDKAMREGQG